ncbi:hypothetical protein [Streptomyces xanthophaeus]|uniref:Uncharacterized protein n=1 Tax=Streptomyces xanthophaeus TaxID=67385 RepID=A0A919LJF9_9ACTN|nr:hypothetical protein [Streptomyces xanthophaeus]GHI90287.1 hypothetical protein Sxan_76510 [Streptomyces xanthophaeus]
MRRTLTHRLRRSAYASLVAFDTLHTGRERKAPAAPALSSALPPPARSGPRQGGARVTEA